MHWYTTAYPSVRTLVAEVHCTICTVYCKSVVSSPARSTPLILTSGVSAASGDAWRRGDNMKTATPKDSWLIVTVLLGVLAVLFYIVYRPWMMY